MLDFINLHGLSHDDTAKILNTKKGQVKKIGEISEWYSLETAGMTSQFNEKREEHIENASGDFTLIDLFAGIGGIKYAFEKARVMCLFSSEWDPYLAKMYEDNFVEKLVGDITKIKKRDIPVGKLDTKYTLSDEFWTGLQRHANQHKAKGNGFGLNKRNERARTLSARYYKDGSEILIDQGSKKKLRRLIPTDCGRCMGFPKKFKITVSDTRAYKCFSNSVVVPVVERLAKQMVKHQILSTNVSETL